MFMLFTQLFLYSQNFSVFSFVYFLVSLFHAMKRNFVFKPGNCIPQTEMEVELEKVVGHKVTKLQTFNAVQPLGKIEKKIICVGN